MQSIGTNSIRVYHVDPTSNHDGCMSAFEDAGIYIWLDLDTFNSYIQGPDGNTPTWNQTQYEAYQEVFDTFQGYDNLAGFFVGNEVLTTGESSSFAPYVKAAARDMKAYRDSETSPLTLCRNHVLTNPRQELPQDPSRLQRRRRLRPASHVAKLPGVRRQQLRRRGLLQLERL